MNAVALDDGARKVAPAVAYARVVARAHEADILECEHIAHDGRIVSRSRRCPARQLRLIETRIARIRDRYLCRKCRLRRDECPPPEDNARATKRARERRFNFFPIKSASCILIPNKTRPWQFYNEIKERVKMEKVHLHKIIRDYNGTLILLTRSFRPYNMLLAFLVFQM